MTSSKELFIDYAKNRYDIPSGPDVLQADCDIITFLLDHCTITIPEENIFFVAVDCAEVIPGIWQERAKKIQPLLEEQGLQDGQDAYAFTGSYDFSHTSPEWDSVIRLGFTGLKERVLQYAKKNNSPEKQRFYEQVIRVYDAIFRFLRRAAKEAEVCKKQQMAKGLIRLSEGAPQTLFEAMQMSIAYYVFQHIFEGTYLRALGRLDQLYYPYFLKEDKEHAKNLVLQYLQEIDKLKAPSNIPFSLCGTDLAGRCNINELSYLFLETYQVAQTSNTKIHILYSNDIPEDFVKRALECIRSGNNSIVFMSDRKIIETLEAMGESREDAVNYTVVGCYECHGNNELPCTCNGRVSLPKALELTLNHGRDLLTDKKIGLATAKTFETYEQLYEAFKKQVVFLAQCAMRATDLYESNYHFLHSSPLLSSTYHSAVSAGGDLYCDYTAKYNNSSINAVGLATAVDSLAAIKKLVFEDKAISLYEMNSILKSDWENREPLRLQIKNNFPKYGNGEEKTDAIAKDIVETLADAIYRKPNAKGGQYRLGLFSIDWRWAMGKKTGASADGRRAGEPLSQNISANFDATREGATAHLLSASVIDYEKVSNGTVVDLDIPFSAVQGANGISALLSTVKTYFSLGGFAVHYNILNTDVLKDAKQNPDKYPHLQVRLCGWNVLFSSLRDQEKDEFIRRSLS